MKVLHLCLIILVFSALVAFSGSNPKSPASISAKGLNSTPTVSSQMFSSQAVPLAVQEQDKQGNETPRTMNPPPKKRCKTALVDQQSYPPSTPSDSLPIRFRAERDDNTVRFVPNNAPDIRDLERRGVETLDQGSDACPATEIPSLPYTDTGVTTDKTDNYSISCLTNDNYPDVIYKYTAQQSATHVIELTLPSNGGMSIRTGGNCPGDNEIACAASMIPNRIILDFVQGVTYYIIVNVPGNMVDNYSLHIEALAPCTADFEFTPPGTISGNTCFARNDCPRWDSEDQIVEVTIPSAGAWTFSMCDDQVWDAILSLTTTCCGDSIIQSRSWGCGYHPPYWASRPVLGPVFLTAGVYYLSIESSNAHSCGAWTITAELIPPCLSEPANDFCQNAGVPATLPATFTGDNTCARHHCDSLTNGQGETWHAFVLDTPASIMVTYDVSQIYYSRYCLLVSGCPCQSIIRTNNDYTPEMFFFNLPAGVYYYPVLRDSIYNDQGQYTITVSTIPSCQVTSQPGDIIECAEIPAQVALGNDCNKGCSGTTSAYQPIEVGQSVYGRAFSYMQSNHLRPESDWYEFTLTDTASVSVAITAEFPVEIGIYDRDCNIWWTDYAFQSTNLPCAPLTLTTECLRPHTYAINVRPEQILMSTDSLHYRFTLTSEACAITCVVTQQSGDVQELEPTCSDGYIDSVNAGCNSNYANDFEDIAVNQTIFGSTGLYHIGSAVYCDMDWFRFTVSETSIITLSAIAEFDVYLIISDYCPGCDGGLAENSGHSCDTVRTSTWCEEAGVYYACVFPSNAQYLPCGAKYRAWVTTAPCVPCTDIRQPGDLLENEPPCSTQVAYYDHFNGGCNSNPPVYGTELHCGQALSGTSGSWWGGSGGKDTDWMPITIGPNTLTVNLVAQFPVMTAILGPTPQGGCDSLRLYSNIGTGYPCDTVRAMSNGTLQAGTYWIYVSPTATYNVMCGSEYRVWITCGQCEPTVVQNVTIRRNGNDIVLRWPSDPDFAGLYKVYASANDCDDTSDNWVALANNIPPVAHGSVTYTLVNAVNLYESRFFKVVSVCP